MQVILAIHVLYKVCHQTHHYKIHLLEYWYIFNRGKHLWIIQLLEVNHHNSGNCFQRFNTFRIEKQNLSPFESFILLSFQAIVSFITQTLHYFFFLWRIYLKYLSLHL